jgi:hypothetical protein
MDPTRRHLWSLVIIPVLGALYLLQLLNGINLLLRPSDPSPVHVQALLVIIFFMIAIYRAWQMIGARNTRVLAMVGDLLRERTTTTVVLDAVEEGDDDGGGATSLVATSGSAVPVPSA